MLSDDEISIPSAQREAVNNFLAATQQQLPTLDTVPLPEKVFHYTNIAGLLGILRTGRMWATHYQYLNDASEGRYTYDLAKDLIAEQGAELGNARIAAFLSAAANVYPGAYNETY